MKTGQVFQCCARRHNSEPFQRVNLCDVFKELEGNKDENISIKEAIVTSKIQKKVKGLKLYK